MYTLYIANKTYSSWSLRPWALMRALNIPFQEKVVNFEAPTNWASFRQFNPAGKVPCLHDGETIVWDSLGITEFLADRHAGVWPSEEKAKIWARCAAAEMHSGFGNLRGVCPMHVGLRIQIDAIPEGVKSDLARISELWSEGLEKFGGPFLAGDRFTAIDAFFAPVVFRIQTYNLPVDAKAGAYVQHMLQQAPIQQWQQDALNESWSEVSHEDAAKAAGRLLEDLRKNLTKP